MMTKVAQHIDSFPVGNRVNLHFALAKALKDVGDYETSFQHLIRGNALKGTQRPYDEAGTLKRWERIREALTADLIGDRAGQGDSSPAPVFILGMPRSGSTLVEQILASHPKIFGADELRFLSDMSESIEGFPESVRSLSKERLRELGGSYMRAVRRLAPSAERITDKRPINFIYAGMIPLILPNARIIHTRRDPRDIAVSCFSVPSIGIPPTLAELGRYIRAYQTHMAHWREVLPQGVMMEVQYEDLVADLEVGARRMVAHCGLEWDDACLDFHKSQRAVRTPSAAQVRQPIYHSAIGRWRHYERQLKPLLDELELLG
jgi:hypothetical protein